MNASARATTAWPFRHPLVLALLAAAAALPSTGCIQEYALEPVAYVNGRVVTEPAGGRTVGVRIDMVGTTTDLVPVTSDHTFCDVEGDFALKTQRLGRGYVVARGVEYDIGFDEVYLSKYGAEESVDRLVPATETPALFEKKPGEALFLVFEQDFGHFTSCDLVGKFNSFSMETARALHDDGSLFDLDPVAAGLQTSGDYQAGDGVWTLRTTLPAGEQQYMFVLDKDGDSKKRDPYEEKSDGGNSVIIVK